jgi:hypothetical protein
MPSPNDFRSAPPEFHPEFGYFWPAAHTRRIVRIGLASTAFGALFGAIAVLAMTPRPDPDLARAETASAAAPVEGRVDVAASTAASNPTVEMPAPAAAQPSAAPVKTCKEQTWPYLDGKCLNGAPRKRQQVRVLRPEEPAQSATAQIVPAMPSDVTAAAQMPETPMAAPKKRQKTTQTRQRKRRDIDEAAEMDLRNRYADPRSAYAAPYGTRYQPPPRRDFGWGW